MTGVAGRVSTTLGTQSPGKWTGTTTSLSLSWKPSLPTSRTQMSPASGSESFFPVL